MADDEYMHMVLASMRVSRSTADESQVQICQLGKQLVAALAEDDLPAVLDIYDEDAELLSTALPPCCGKGAIRMYYEATLKAKMQFLERAPHEVTNPAPLWAFERGRYTIELKGRISKGRYFILWKRYANGWRIVQECRNDMPQQSEPAQSNQTTRTKTTTTSEITTTTMTTSTTNATPKTTTAAAAATTTTTT